MGTTEVIGTRVGEGYKQRFTDMCVKAGATPREVLENLVDDYFACRFTMSGGHVENGLLTRVEDDFEDTVNTDDSDYYNFGLDTWVSILRKKEYPDEIIKRIVDTMISAAYDMPRFDPRKKRGEDWA